MKNLFRKTTGIIKRNKECLCLGLIVSAIVPVVMSCFMIAAR